MTLATEALGPLKAPLDASTLPVVGVALFSALLMLGGGALIAPPLALVACGAALGILLTLKRAYRRVRWTPHPVMEALERARELRRPGATVRPLYLVSSRGTAHARTPEAAPLQRLAQAQGDQRFLMECRRNVSGRWLLLLEEMEAAWARRRIGELRWPLYQLRMQSALWGAEAVSRQAREFERLLERESILGFEYRCGRALTSLRASLEGRPTGVQSGL